jgi:hypothetical protein
MRDPFRRARFALLASCLAAALSVADPASADYWTVTPGLSFGIDYDSNRGLSPQPTGSAGMTGSFQSAFARSTERWSVTLTPEVDFQRYTDAIFARTNNYSVAGGFGWTNERSSFTLSSQWADQSLLTAERYDTGIVDLGTRRVGTTVSASATLAESERFSGSLSAQIQNAQFEGQVVAALQNSRYDNFGATESFAASDRVSYYSSVSSGEFTSPGTPGATRSQSGVVGYRFQTSPRLSVSVDAGANRLEYGPSITTGLVFDLNVVYATTVGSVTLTAQRAASPSGFGLLVERDSGQLSLSHALSDRLTVSSAFSLYRNAVTVGPIGLDSRTYSDATLSLAWRQTEHWTIAAHLGGAIARERGGVGDASGWNAGVTASWSPVPWTTSR